MGTEGVINTDRKDTEDCLSSMADWYTWKDLDISGESSPNIVDGYLVISVKYPNLLLKGIINQSSSATATVIAKTAQGDEATITIASSSSSGKLPTLTHVKQTGTSDNLTLLFQKR